MTLPKPLRVLLRPAVKLLRQALLEFPADGPVEEYLSLKPGGALSGMVSEFNWRDASRRKQVFPDARTQVVLHLHYPELWPEFAAALGTLEGEWGLVVTLTDNAKDIAPEIETCFSGARIVAVENRGRDCGPFFRLLEDGVLDGADAVLKLHGKRSLHGGLPTDAGELWRRALVLTLVRNAKSVLSRREADPQLGIVGPGNFLVPNHRVSARTVWFDVRPATEAFFLSRGLPLPRIEFFAGTMFWLFRPALDALKALDLTQAEFEDESLHSEASMAHVMERSFVSVVREAGYRVGTV